VLREGEDRAAFLARAAEALGFRDLWLGEHVAIPSRQRVGLYHDADIIRDDTDLYDVWTVCGAVLAVTDELVVAPGVLIAGLRHPVVTALAAATASAVGDGRFRLGLGAGWLEEEFELFGIDFRSRFRRIEEVVAVVRALAAGGAAEFHGEFYDFAPVTTNRSAASFPIIFGGLTEAAIARAARLGDGWYGVPGLSLDRHL
ncbi:MAG TPA: LLM class flavin-dependent oxidoreductase, partial [Ilumatobacteraceae bacterium]|nr:LLM class flavin-dependent oxidoreductase [Ilumatobacteraceae bacterium]